MGRSFDIPHFYRSSLIAAIKRARRTEDHRKQNVAPSIIDLGDVCFKVARHFGFCFGVENAIEIAYKALEENPSRRVFLLSEMIHNPHVNNDLVSRGVRFILSPEGRQLVPFEQLSADDIVIVPAFGTTVALFERLESLGINPRRYNATCPFVEKVWKRAAQLGERGFSIVIHGQHLHEETRATFSHAVLSAPSIVVRDLHEAELLARYIRGELSLDRFYVDFEGRCSEHFDPHRDLQRIGVVNQTTMLATETQRISQLLRKAMEARYGTAEIGTHFADTRDTLCYATAENQEAVKGLVQSGGDLAIVVGGYNSSNTSHLVEICEEHLPTFYIKDADEIVDQSTIRHLDWRAKRVQTSSPWLPDRQPVQILLTAGASCPDALVDQVIVKVAQFFGVISRLESVYVGFLAAEQQNI